jgi:hypothetical protein
MPKAKKVVEEPECCSVCMDKYTPIIRKKCECKYCKAATCSKCIERYLLDRHEDAHCLHCRVNYNDTTLREICTKTYLQQTYFKHRQEVLINRERANLPGLQEIAIEEKKRREGLAKINELKSEMSLIESQRDMASAKYNLIYSEYYKKLANKENVDDLKVKMQETLTECDELYEKVRKIQIQINKIRWPNGHHFGRREDNNEENPGAAVAAAVAAGGGVKEERKKFIRRCTRSECQGFLSTAWKCEMCEYYSCNKCFQTKTQKHDDPHECTKEDLETAELIKKDCKPCPNCGEFIMKISGCFGKDTPILMWNGTTKMSQDIKVGDKLVGDDGMKRTVIDTTNGVDTMYEVKQNNGLTYVVNSKHILVLKYTGEKNIYWNTTDMAWIIKWFDREQFKNRSYKIRISDTKTKEETLKEMEQFKETLDFPEEIEITIEDYMKLSKSTKKSLVGFKSNGINWKKQDVLLDPYLMGLYLGDGINDGMSFAVNPNDDPEILEYILKWAEEHDSEVVHDNIYTFRLRRRGCKQNIQKAIGKGATSEACKGCIKKVCNMCDIPEVKYTDNDTYKTPQKNKLLECITYYGMLRGKKKMPSEYLVNDRDTRLKLLAGIIDTDGHLNKANEGKRITIVSAYKDFAEHIVLLSQSLGFNTTIRPVSKKGVCFKKGGEKKDYNDHYQINISGNISEIPTLIKRKKCINSSPNKDWMRTSIEVKELGLGEYYGWKVDSNRRFVLNDLTVNRNCSQIWCVSCKTPWDWNTGKVETGGIIHNPHYFEWMRRNGNAAPRNPADVPCGGYPGGWELVQMPRGMNYSIANHYFEFHRICLDLQDRSERQYRTHIDNDSTTNINVKFLVGDYDEKRWGQLLGKNERKRKRDSEVQEVFAAFRMVAVELINRVQNYRSEDGLITRFTNLPILEADKFLKELDVEINALITMINDALRNISIAYSYTVPYIAKRMENYMEYYNIETKNFASEVKKKRVTKGEEEDDDEEEEVEEVPETNVIVEPVKPVTRKKPVVAPITSVPITSVPIMQVPITSVPITQVPTTEQVENPTPTTQVRRKKPVVAPPAPIIEEPQEVQGEDIELQAAIAASLSK